MKELVLRDLNKKLIFRGDDGLAFIIVEEYYPQSKTPYRIIFPLTRKHQQELLRVLVDTLGDSSYAEA